MYAQQLGSKRTLRVWGRDPIQKLNVFSSFRDESFVALSQEMSGE